METGTIAHLRIDKGYFFIEVHGREDVFGHANDLVDLPFDEQLEQRRVRFDVITTPKGDKAKNIQAAE